MRGEQQLVARENRINEYRQKSAQGDTNAMYALGWEYFRGEFVPKDVDAAIAVFRKLELIHPEIARFNIAKIKYSEGDASFISEIKSDCDHGFGPSLYLMGVYSLRKIGGVNGRTAAAQYFGEGAKHGHLPSIVAAWTRSGMSFRQRASKAIPTFRAALRLLAAAWHNDNDISTLT